MKIEGKLNTNATLCWWYCSCNIWRVTSSIKCNIKEYRLKINEAKTKVLVYYRKKKNIPVLNITLEHNKIVSPSRLFQVLNYSVIINDGKSSKEIRSRID